MLILLVVFLMSLVSIVADAILWARSRLETADKSNVSKFRSTRRPRAIRIRIAVLLGIAVVGGSLYPTTLEFRDLPDAAQSELFMQYNPHERGHAQTLVLAGFPWRGVEGNGGGGWTTDAPASRESYALWFNFGCAFLISLVIAYSIPRRWLSAAHLVAFGLAATGGLQGLKWLVYYHD